MIMKEYKFKTNIKCGGCVATVTPHLDSAKDIQKWEVDTANPDKILTVKTENMDEDEITGLVNKAGFKAEAI